MHILSFLPSQEDLILKSETVFSREFRQAISKVYPETIWIRTSPNQIQGIPDWIMLYQNRYFVFEFKKYEGAPSRPNQPYYVALLNDWSYARFVYPENREEVLDEVFKILSS